MKTSHVSRMSDTDANRLLDHDQTGDYRNYDLDDNIVLDAQVDTTLPDPTMSAADHAWLANLPDVHVPYLCEVCDSELDVHGFCPTCETE